MTITIDFWIGVLVCYAILNFLPIELKTLVFKPMQKYKYYILIITVIILIILEVFYK